jgi:hypothetical protein
MKRVLELQIAISACSTDGQRECTLNQVYGSGHFLFDQLHDIL